MIAENVYRWLLLGLMAGFVPFAARFRLRAARAGSVSRRGEGAFILVGLRLCGLATWGAILTYLIDPTALRWAGIGLPDAARLAGLALGIASGVWTIWTFRNLGPNLTDTVAVRPTAFLVTGGPYRLVRHPFYLGVAALVAAFTLLSDCWLIGVLGAVVLAFLALRTPLEEAALVGRFGEAYRDYAARTRRFLPRPGRA